MSAIRKEKCEHCNHLRVWRRRQLGVRQVKSLRALDKFGREAHLRHDLKLDHIAFCTFAHLKYWQLVEKVFNEESGTRRQGVWRITDRGQRFLAGTIAIPKYAVVVDDEVDYHEGDSLYVNEILPYDDPAWGKR